MAWKLLVTVNEKVRVKRRDYTSRREREEKHQNLEKGDRTAEKCGEIER
jgi:hypothetical protein